MADEIVSTLTNNYLTVLQLIGFIVAIITFVFYSGVKISRIETNINNLSLESVNKAEIARLENKIDTLREYYLKRSEFDIYKLWMPTLADYVFDSGKYLEDLGEACIILARISVQLNEICKELDCGKEIDDLQKNTCLLKDCTKLNELSKQCYLQYCRMSKEFEGSRNVIK